MLFHRLSIELFLRFQRRIFSKTTHIKTSGSSIIKLAYRWIFMPNRSMRKLSTSGGRPTCRWTNGFPASMISVRLGHDATAMTSSSSSICDRKKDRIVICRNDHLAMRWMPFDLPDCATDRGIVTQEMRATRSLLLPALKLDQECFPHSLRLLRKLCSWSTHHHCSQDRAENNLSIDFLQKRTGDRSERRAICQWSRTSWSLFALQCRFREFLNDLMTVKNFQKRNGSYLIVL